MKKIFIFLLLTTFYLLHTTDALAAATLSLSPASQSTAVNQTFEVNVILNTGGVSSNGVDAVITYNPQIVIVQSVTFGASPLFVSSNTSTPNNTSGKLILNSSVMSSAFAYNGTGTLATITFKGQVAGTSSVAFSCTASTTNGDSNVWNTQAQDIINCSGNVGGSYTITSGSTTEPTSTPAPTSSPGEPTATPAPPVSGNINFTIFPMILGSLLVLSGVLFKFIFLKI